MFWKRIISKEEEMVPKFKDCGIFIQDPVLLEHLHLIELDNEQLQYVRSIKEIVSPHLEELANKYYAQLEEVKLYREIISKYSSSQKLKKTLTKHLAEFLDAKIDDAYIESRYRIANMHVRIGLPTRGYMAAFNYLESEMRKIIFAQGFSVERLEKTLDGVNKLCNFEQQLVLHAYEKVTIKKIELQHTEIKEEVKGAVEDIVEELKSNAESTHQAIDVLVHKAREVTNHLDNSVKDAEMMKSASLNGYAQMEDLERQNIEINSRTSEMTNMVKQLDVSSNEINHVIEIVKGIASQTNLLALNSAIEAARAGEHGKGFAVVADEVRKLADQTKQSVEQIAILISESTGITSQVVSAIQAIQELIDTGLEKNAQTLHAFEHISTAVDTTIHDFTYTAEQIRGLAIIIQGIDQASDELDQAAKTLAETINGL